MTGTGDPDHDFHVNAAARCNNSAWDLIEQNSPSPEDLCELLSLAATARHHWHMVGTPMQIAHADLLFGWAAARSGAGRVAMAAAEAAQSVFDQNDAAPWERAFVHAALAMASHATGDSAGHRTHFQLALDLGAQITGPSGEYFQAAFRTVPKPEGT